MRRTKIDYDPQTGIGTLYFDDVKLCHVILPPAQADTIRKLIADHIKKEQRS